MAWLNDDAEPEPDWLATLEDTLDKAPLAAAATSLLVRPDGTTQSAGVRLTADGHGADLTEPSRPRCSASAAARRCCARTR